MQKINLLGNVPFIYEDILTKLYTVKRHHELIGCAFVSLHEDQQLNL